MDKWKKEIERLSLPELNKLFARDKLKKKQIYTYAYICIYLLIVHTHIVYSMTLKWWLSLIKQSLAAKEPNNLYF